MLDLGDGFYRQCEEVIDAFMNNETSEDQNQASLDNLSYLLNDKVFVISLLGSTSSGKSFIARHLLNEYSDNDISNGPVSLDEKQKKGATTANINCYMTKSNTNQKILILDCEGEKGSAFPLFYYARQRFQHLSQTKEKAQQRRQAISDYIPKLAYIMSNVIILVGNDDFASTDYLTRCREFALKANNGVTQIVNRPLLILVHNKASLVQSLDYGATTRQFFEIHGVEANDLRLYFSNIACFCIPHKEQLQRTKTGILDGQELFNKQMQDLKNIFVTIRNHWADRILTHAQWLYLLRRILPIVQSDRSVSIHTLLNETVIHDDHQMIELSRRCFLQRYNLQLIHSPSWFKECARFAIRILAHCLAIQAFDQRELISERVIYEICERTLEKLSIRLEEFQPCEALYTGKGHSSKSNHDNHPVYCYQHRGAHEGGHRTCISVYGLAPLKEYFGWSSTDVWRGEFVSSTEGKMEGTIFSENISSDLSCLVRELINALSQDLEAKYYMFTDLLLSNQYSEEPLDIFSRICFCRSNEKLTSNISNILVEETHQHKQQRTGLNAIKIMQNLFSIPFSQANTKKWVVCWKCYEQFSAAWNRFSLKANLPAPDQEVPACAICFDNQRDFLFIPCGHRGVCEDCADKILEEQGRCPFCRASVTAKQRVHDV